MSGDSPLFPCTLAEPVPSVEHHAAADGEEGGGLEASCGQVALWWAVEVSNLVLVYSFVDIPGTRTSKASGRLRSSSSIGIDQSRFDSVEARSFAALPVPSRLVDVCYGLMDVVGTASSVRVLAQHAFANY